MRRSLVRGLLATVLLLGQVAAPATPVYACGHDDMLCDTYAPSYYLPSYYAPSYAPEPECPAWCPCDHEPDPPPPPPPPYSPTYYGPTYYGPTYYGPTYYGPTYYGPTYYGPTYYGPGYYGPSYYEPTYYGPTYYGPTYYGPTYYGPTYYSPAYYAPAYPPPTPVSYEAVIYPIPVITIGAGGQPASAEFIWPLGRTLELTLSASVSGTISMTMSDGSVVTGGSATLLTMDLDGVSGSYDTAPAFNVVIVPGTAQTFRLTDAALGYNVITYTGQVQIMWPDGHSETRSIALPIRVNHSAAVTGP